jgi:multiple sugar transport system ATP-binding protein
VASFIGTPPMNFVPAVFRDGGATVAASGFSLPTPERLRTATAGRDGKKVVLGVRPENLREGGSASREGHGTAGMARIAGIVEFVEPLGHEVIVHTKVGEDLLVAKLEPHRAPEMGDPIELEVELDAIHLFDAETELRLA